MDDLSSTLTIRVQGFEPGFAQRLNKAILQESESFVNELSHKLAREKLSFAEGELTGAGDRLQAAKASVLAKKTTAMMAVDRDRKLDEPLEPNTEPAEPDPKAAPMSAPLPCCSKTRTMMAKAATT
jgi:hypothetical protein